jgi:hypothetical protein
LSLCQVQKLYFSGLFAKIVTLPYSLTALAHLCLPQVFAKNRFLWPFSLCQKHGLEAEGAIA